jgi:hypothetical protein
VLGVLVDTTIVMEVDACSVEGGKNARASEGIAFDGIVVGTTEGGDVP